MAVKFSDFTSSALNSTGFIVGYNSATNQNIRIAKSSLDSTYQATLVSGDNIKTINGSSVLGSGDLTISGGGGGVHVLIKPESNKKYGLGVNGTAAFNTANTTANEIVLAPFIPANTITIKSLETEIRAVNATGLVRILVYSDLNGKPDTKLIESSDLSSASTGVKTYLVNYTFNAGTTYWVGIQANALISLITHSATQVAAIDYPSGFQPYVSKTSTSYLFGSAPATLVSQASSNKTPFSVLLTAN